MNRTTYLSIFAATLMLAACSNKEDITPAPNGTEDGTPVTLTSTTVSGFDLLPTESLDQEAQSGTRSAFDGTDFAWTVGDKVSVSDGTLMFSYEVETANGGSCSFKVSDGHNAFAATDGKPFYCAYPAAAVKGWNGSTVTEQIYTEQDYAENNGAMGAYLVTASAADAEGHVSFSFAPSASVLDVDLSTLGVTPKAVYIKSNSGVNICGTLKCNASDCSITMVTNDASAYADNSQSDVIGVTNITDGAASARFYLLPVQLTGGVTVTVVDNNGNYYTKVSKSDIGLTAGAPSVTNALTKQPEQIAIPATIAVKPYYKKVNFGAASTATRKGNWMATIPSNVHWNLLSTPGAHDAATKGMISASECQDLTIQQLLETGVRCFDIRPGYKLNEAITASSLYIWHGITKTSVKYVDAMQTLVDFVKNNPTEAITVVMVKEASTGSDRSDEMWGVLNACHTEHAAYMKVLNHSYYNLADYRGRICYFNRTGTDCTGTASITNWPDNATVNDWSCITGGNTCKANVQDRYNINGATKQNAVKDMLVISSANTDVHNFTFNYTSSANSPSSYASSTNPAIATYLNSGNITGSTGYLMCDFIGCTKNSGKELLSAIINQNYKYLFTGRTRNTTARQNGIGIEVAGDDAADNTTVYAKPRMR